MAKLTFINKSEYFNYEDGAYVITGNKASNCEPDVMTGITGGRITKQDSFSAAFVVSIVGGVSSISFSEFIPVAEMAGAMTVITALLSALNDSNEVE